LLPWQCIYYTYCVVYHPGGIPHLNLAWKEVMIMLVALVAGALLWGLFELGFSLCSVTH